jgi:hypothetical protein
METTQIDEQIKRLQKHQESNPDLYGYIAIEQALATAYVARELSKLVAHLVPTAFVPEP